jgi:hypothetical protein
MELPSDFNLTLTSDQDMNRFHNNNSSEFLNHLNGPIALDPEKYQVGLVQLSFEFQQENNPNSTPATIPQPSKEATPFFGKANGDNLCTVWKKVSSEFAIKNQGRNVKEFITKASAELKLLKAPLEIFLSNKNGKTRIKLVVNAQKDREIQIAPSLTAILGFEQTVFMPGEYTATNEMSNHLLEQRPKEQSFSFALSRWTEMDRIAVDEPDSRDPEDVAFTFNMALQRANLLVEMGAAVENDGFIIQIFKPIHKLKLPDSLNIYLNLRSDHVFETNSSYINLKPALTTSNSNPQNPQTTQDSSMVFVYCDAIEPYFVGSSCLPIIRTVLNPSNNTNTLQFSPVFYLKPTGEELRHIKLKLLDSNFEPLPKSVKKTIAVLHFKRFLL